MFLKFSTALELTDKQLFRPLLLSMHLEGGTLKVMLKYLKVYQIEARITLKTVAMAKSDGQFILVVVGNGPKELDKVQMKVVLLFEHIIQVCPQIGHLGQSCSGITGIV